MSMEFDREFDNIREYMNLLDDKDLKRIISETSTQEIIDIWEDLNEEEEIKMFSLLDMERKVEVISELPPSSQESIILALSEERAKILLEEMEPDDLTDFIQSISQEVRDSVWSKLSDNAKEETKLLLKFDEDDAAGIMTPRYLAISATLTVKQALNWVRKQAKNVETIYYIYAVDQLKRLRGVLSIKDLLSSDDNEFIYNIMVEKVVSVREHTDQEEAAKILEVYDLIALPVVDEYNRLLGIITFDDIIEVIREEHTEDVYKMGAMGGSTEKYLGSSIWRLVKKRIPWLAILLLAATLTTNVLAYFENLFISISVLILFIPTIIGTGGNSGTQSSTLVIRGLATGEIDFGDILRILGKEILVGIIMGIAMGILIVLRAWLLPPFIDLMQAFAVGTALSCVVIVATLVGAFFPLIIHKIGLDPAVMAGPLMTTIIDLAGLTIYFLAAKAILGI
jgi:magnesium transporter